MDNHKNQQFFQETIEQNKGIMLKVARTYCQNEDDRQDLLQEILVQIWHSIHKYNDQFSMSTWLYRISLNVAISFYRKNTSRTKKLTRLDGHQAQTPYEDKTEHEQNLNLLEQFINDLRESDKALILLYLEDKSHTEIAEILGISVSNVGTKIGRIKEKLKMQFSQVKS